MHFKGMEKVADLILMNLLFVLCSLPIVTLGASATAMHYCLRRWREGEGSITRDFFRAFRLNFRQATILWLGFLLLFAWILLNFWLISGWTGPMYNVVMVLLLAVAMVLLAWICVALPLLARFDNTTVQMAKNALLLALTSPVRSLCTVLINIFPVVFAIVLPGLFLICSVLWIGLLCSVSGFVVQLLLAPVFDRLGTEQRDEE